MISLIYPKEWTNRLVYFKGMVLGPFTSLFDFEADKMEFTSRLESMTESRGLYHENNVEHQSIGGIIHYCPFVLGSKLTPTPQYPRRMWIPVTDHPTGAAIYAELGLMVHGGTTYKFVNTARTQTQHWAGWINPLTNMWELVLVQCSATNPHSVEGYAHYRVSSIVKSNLSHQCTVTSVVTSWSLGLGGIATPHNWLQPQGIETIASLGDVYFRDVRQVVTTSSVSCYWYTYDTEGSKSNIYSPKLAEEQIDSLVMTCFPEEFPIEDMNYGELAMSASAKVNANKVNMLSFLKDLRHPTEMIPKLKNLNNLKNLRLKDLSDSYLSVKYGVLPTVSDIQEIVAAFKRHSPYTDSNGWNVYTAMHEETLWEGDLFFSLVQRIKLAIDDEDSDFQLLCEKLDSIGLFPTFEKLWDLVPYSFVVDWLIDVGGFLERVDTHLRLERLNIRYATMSRKTIVDGYLPPASVQHPVSGTVTWIQYHRWVSDQCPVPPLFPPPEQKDFNHWLESGALLLQRV